MRHLISRLPIYLLAAGITLLVSSAWAADIAHWVDRDGVTHFGDPQFAPPGEATLITVNPANGMLKPEPGPVYPNGSPRMLKITKAAKQNKRGWRGYPHAGARNFRHNQRNYR